MASNKVEIYLFETIERLSRFFIHLEDLDKQFYSNEKNILRDKSAFISSYEECLEKLIEIVIGLCKESKRKLSKTDTGKVLNELESINITIKNLQSKLLVHLPRPAEPVELRRFCRVIYKQIIKLDEKNKDRISIYVNENTEDNTYASDPLEIFKQDEINSLINSVSKFINKAEKKIKIKQLDVSKKRKKDTIIHISIPRIEAKNPCHWPSLIHEVSHNLMKEDWFNGQGIHSDFVNFLKKTSVKSGIKEIITIIDLKSWLIECWCDLFACALIGPSFYFSQYSTFIHSLEYNENKKYPPNLFRLKLIQKFLEHRFKYLLDDENFCKMITECEDLVTHLDNKNNTLLFNDDSELSNLFIFFNQYFLHEFFILENGLLNFKNNELSTLFDNISSFVNKFELEKLNHLVSSLNEGLPISSYRMPSPQNPLLEKPNYVQEIFLASWMFRNISFRQKILICFKSIRKTDIQIPLISEFKNCIVKEFLRLDQSILQSIQISEWVDLFVDDDPSIENLGIVYKGKANKRRRSGLLVDRDIYRDLVNNEIRVLPLININKQLGSTSLDIRLGTSFEVFFPNQFGIVDFTDSDAINNIKYNSKKINLDYIEHIPINPGQFMLGHSMEYIKLPDQISAELEGRSSFARLGIEIHMTAGFVDPGFEGVLTFEIFNAGTNPVMLYPGLRIGQLRFMTVEKPSLGYAKKQSPKYSSRFEHHFSLHGEDYEVQRISLEREKPL